MGEELEHFALPSPFQEVKVPRFLLSFTNSTHTKSLCSPVCLENLDLCPLCMCNGVCVSRDWDKIRMQELIEKGSWFHSFDRAFGGSDAHELLHSEGKMTISKSWMIHASGDEERDEETVIESLKCREEEKNSHGRRREQNSPLLFILIAQRPAAHACAQSISCLPLAFKPFKCFASWWPDGPLKPLDHTRPLSHDQSSKIEIDFHSRFESKETAFHVWVH